MKWLVAVMIATLLSGCAFKKSEGDESGAPEDRTAVVPQPESAVSYRIAGSAAEKGGQGPDIVASSPLSRDSTTHFLRSEVPLVIPAIVPDSIGLKISLSVLGSDTGLKGEVRSGERSVRAIPAAAFARSNGSVEFTLGDLKTLLPSDSQAQLDIVVYALDSTGRATETIGFGVTTPPSKSMAQIFMPLARYEREKQITIPENFKKLPGPSGSTIELVGILEVADAEAAPLVVELPYRLAHKLSRIESGTQVSAGDCSYSVSKSSNEVALDSEIRLLPLGKAANDGSDGSALTTARVVPGDVVQIGMYSGIPASFVLPDDKMTSQTVPTRCSAQCQRGAEGDWNDQGKWGGECLACGGIQGNYGAVCYACMNEHREWCAWQDWRAWKDYTAVAAGLEYSLKLVAADDTDQASNRYSMKFLNQTVPGRSRVIVSDPINIHR